MREIKILLVVLIIAMLTVIGIGVVCMYMIPDGDTSKRQTVSNSISEFKDVERPVLENAIVNNKESEANDLSLNEDAYADDTNSENTANAETEDLSEAELDMNGEERHEQSDSLTVSTDSDNSADETPDDSIRYKVDRLPLNPRKSGLDRLDMRLEEIMPEILEGCEDTYDKIEACYAYLIANCHYGETVKYEYSEDAYILLTEYQGSCTYYVSALYYMLLYIGVDNNIVNGYRYVHEGFEPSFHRWNEIVVDGTVYVLDSQWDDSLHAYEAGEYYRFFMTHEELSEYYQF